MQGVTPVATLGAKVCRKAVAQLLRSGDEADAYRTASLRRAGLHVRVMTPEPPSCCCAKSCRSQKSPPTAGKSQIKPFGPACRDMNQWPKLGRWKEPASVDYWVKCPS